MTLNQKPLWLKCESFIAPLSFIIYLEKPFNLNHPIVKVRWPKRTKDNCPGNTILMTYQSLDLDVTKNQI